MKVIKFGGAVLNSINGFNKMLEIVKTNGSSKCLLVISAFSKSTRNLKKAAHTAETGDLAKAINISKELYREYCSFAKILFSNTDELENLIIQYNTSFDKLNDLLKGISITCELTDRTLDAIMSYGEMLSLLTAYHYLIYNSVDIVELNSTQVLITDDNFGAARPILQICEDNIKSKVIPLFHQHNLVLTQGFVASNQCGEITTMGIESSNLTAAIYAKYLNAEACIIYTDVEGIRTADPKLQSTTNIIRNLSYDQAYLLGVSGLKLIFPDMIELIRDSGIEILIKSAYQENGEFSIISDKAADGNSLIVIEHDDYNLIKVKLRSVEEYYAVSSLMNSKSQADRDLIYFSNNEFIVAAKNLNIWNSLTEYNYTAKAVCLTILINLSNEENQLYYEKRSELENLYTNCELKLIQIESAMFFLKK